MNKNTVRARLTIYGHEEMDEKEFKFFKKWIKAVSEEMQKQKRGTLSKAYRATLYKQL